MKLFMEEYGSTILCVILVSLMLFQFMQVVQQTKEFFQADEVVMIQKNTTLKHIKKPILIIKNEKLEIGEDFNYQDYIIQAVDHEGQDIKENVCCYDDVDTTKAGVYTVKFEVKDGFGLQNIQNINFIVE